jgi:hypothetical protein
VKGGLVRSNGTDSLVRRRARSVRKVVTLRLQVIESKCCLGNQTQRQLRRYIESSNYLGNQAQQLLQGPQLWKEQVASKQIT